MDNNIQPFNYDNDNDVSNIKNLGMDEKSELFDDMNSWDYLFGEGQSMDSDKSSISSESSSNSSESSNSTTKDIETNIEKEQEKQLDNMNHTNTGRIVELKQLFDGVIDDLYDLPIKTIQDYVDNYKKTNKLKSELNNYFSNKVKDKKKVNILINRIEEVPFYSEDLLYNDNKLSASEPIKKTKNEIKKNINTNNNMTYEYSITVLKIIGIFFFVILLHYLATYSYKK